MQWPVDRQIGVYRLRQPLKVQQQFECAAWYRDLDIQPEDYPILATVETTGQVCYSSIRVRFEGICTGSDFSSYYCGVPVGAPKHNEEVGKRFRHDQFHYSSDVAAAILKATDPGWELLGFEPRWIDPQHQHAGLFRQ